jgi:hypothetical protein
MHPKSEVVSTIRPKFVQSILDRQAPVIQPGKIKPLTFLLNKLGEKHPQFDMPNTAMMLGGGCSVSSGVPLSGGLMEQCRMYAFLLEETVGGGRIAQEQHFDQVADLVNQQIDRYQAFVKNKESIFAQEVEDESKDWLPLIKEFDPGATWNEYRDQIVWQRLYAKWFEAYSQEPLDRFRFVERMVHGLRPGPGYLLLATMVENGLIRNLLTTNFEDLLEDSIVHGVGMRCNVFQDDEYSRYISIHSERPNLIKLNGDYRYALSSNGVKNILALTEKLLFKFEELLYSLDLVVLGYNGTDHSIMSNILKIKKERPFGLYWCGLNPAMVPWRVAKLINNTPNSFFIKIQGFDEVMAEMFSLYGKKSAQDLVAQAQARQSYNDQSIRDLVKTLPPETGAALQNRFFPT